MSKKTILKCDRCGTEGKNEETVLFDVILGTTTTSYAYSAIKVVPRYREWKKEWCEKCCDEFHLLKKAEPQEESPLPTLEDMVREIVREEIG